MDLTLGGNRWLALSPPALSMPRSKGIVIGFWKEWAYAGFAITLGSALIAHFSVGDGPEAWGFAAATGVLWGLSYFFWRRLPTTAASA